MNMIIVDRRTKVILRMTDYELWEANLIPERMVMNISDHDPWLTCLLSYIILAWLQSGTILTHADTASIPMSMLGWISRTNFFYKVGRIVTLGSRYTYVNTSIWFWFIHPGSRIEAISVQDIISHYFEFFWIFEIYFGN